MKQLYLFSILILSCHLSLSAVNLRNGSYNESWIDFIEPSPGIEMKIERFYNSRSVYTGVFGFGWCTFLETRLTITSDGIINLTECGGGLEVTYFPKDFDIKSPQDTIRKIVSDYKKKFKLSNIDAKNLMVQLQNNTKMRFEYANRMGLVDIRKIKTKNNIFYAKVKGLENIRFNGRFYERKKHDGQIQRFDQRGRLIQFANKAGHWIKIHYKGSRIAFVADKVGRRLNFSYAGNGKLQRVFNGKGLEATYQFEGDNLKSVTNMWSKTYVYHYDGNHNLLKVDFPDKTSIKMAYNVQKDWIKTYTNRRNCVETYDFLLSKDNPQNHYWGTHTSQCPNKPLYKGRHEFWYKAYSFSKDKYLHRVRENYRDSFKDAYFHPYLGKPISVRENLVYRGFSYYLNGLINKTEFKSYAKNREILSWNKMIFRYNLPQQQITSAKKTRLNKLGQVTSVENLTYNYNTTGLLKKALNKKGYFISIGYNDDGKVNQMRDEKKAELLIRYRPGEKKPFEIEQKGLGKISIAYDSQGQVKSVESTGKRNVASSVVEKFLEMIQFLEPLGENLKI